MIVLTYLYFKERFFLAKPLSTSWKKILISSAFEILFGSFCDVFNLLSLLLEFFFIIRNFYIKNF